MAVPEPSYEILHRADGFEVRRYGTVVVAETRFPSSDRRHSNEAFSTLAGFIFRRNRRRDGTATSQRIAMTAPVNLDRRGNDWVLQFFLPPEFDEQTVPQPLDERVVVRSVPPRTVAVRRYRGRWTEELFRERATQLSAALERSPWRACGEPILARYDPPWTPWFLRRNEVWIEVESR